MRIAFILPSLANTGPIIVARDIINTILDINPKMFDFAVFYFDDKIELDFNCKTQQIQSDFNVRLAGFDIIHSHGYRPDKFLYENRKLIQGKRISTIHCDVFQDLKHSYNLLISVFFGLRWISYLKKMDLVVALTNQHKSFYSKYISQKKLDVIYNGRTVNNAEIDDTDKSFFKNLRTEFPDFNFIGAFAGLTTRKGLDMVIKALEKLPNCVFIIIGDGKARSDLKKLALKLKVEDRCFFLGYRKDASRYLKEIDLFAMPSRSEAFPLALIEATLQGTTCICSDIPVLKEVYSSSEVSYFELENIESLKNAIEVAIDSKDTKWKATRKTQE